MWFVLPRRKLAMTPYSFLPPSPSAAATDIDVLFVTTRSFGSELFLCTHSAHRWAEETAALCLVSRGS